MLDQEPAPSICYRIQPLQYSGRYGIKTGSYTALQPQPRALLEVPVEQQALKKIECGTCEPKVTSMSYGRVYELIDLVSSSSIDITASVFNITAVLKSRFFLLDPLTVDRSAMVVPGDFPPGRGSTGGFSTSKR